MNRKFYVIIELCNLKRFLRSGQIVAAVTRNNTPQYDEDPYRLFANTYDPAKYFCGRSFLIFLIFEKEEADFMAAIDGLEGVHAVNDFEVVVRTGCCCRMGVYGFGMEHTVVGVQKECDKMLPIEQHPEWYR